MDEAHGRAMKLLTDNRDMLERVAEALIERETIDSVDLDMLMRGEPLPEMERNDPAPPPVPGSEETRGEEAQGTAPVRQADPRPPEGNPRVARTPQPAPPHPRRTPPAPISSGRGWCDAQPPDALTTSTTLPRGAPVPAHRMVSKYGDR